MTKQNPNISVLLLQWYDKIKRDLPWRKTRDPYQIWVSEMMLQQTQVQTMLPYFKAFLSRFPTVDRLDEASLEEVLTLWKGLGYYSRARYLWQGAHVVMTRFNGQVPSELEELQCIPGIGPYTAAAIASIAFGKVTPVIDGNVKRVMARLLIWPEDINRQKSYSAFLKVLNQWISPQRPGDFNQAMMELGALVCTPKSPDCDRCPLRAFCKAYLNDTPLAFPKKRPTSAARAIPRLLFVLKRNDAYYIQQRPEQGLLANLWEFPGTDFEPEGSLTNPQQILNDYQRSVRDRQFDDAVVLQLEQNTTVYGPVTHVFSHIRWQLYWIIVDVEARDGKEEITAPPRGRWVNRAEMSKIAIPNAFRSVIESLS